MPFDCSEVFPKHKSAECVVIRNEARVKLYNHDEHEYPHEHLVMDIDKIANFLEQCRKQQDPRIHHLA